ncbi:MAG: UTP--glucose-1-phosphate uridylyltransferase [Pelatocladus maniniholoensis HA4357-MV3]|jgi:UTP--glucose-1-phosphate uridylyltransferase|uniref:UTP--glucose-1-phosphate uridylyltransferase n=1 Tax=Pelatocladus maniniholoensis HA4357-MV3 TaxID=1117104 RepID=A0A9E3LW93_9NOST|nr:UTP--glucose-1-phosphate uridylyltransferase [Pelatocladus maniniholoensis HA4357-MV3]BAZ68147.1 nucleotidyl transferase [Fischerella sp. NIES-4106]
MPKTQIKKAVIPAAGFGTRLFPATKVVKKELFPIIDQDGRVKPVIQLIVEEAISAGIEEIGIIIQPEDKRIFIDLFKYPPKAELFEKLSPENQKHSKHIVDLGDRIKFLSQKEQAGYGHAVYCAKEWVNDQPFLLMLGDHIYASNIKKSCARQVLEVYAQANLSVVGLTTISEDMIHKAGCVTGVWQQPDSILSLTQVYEKPTVEYARQHLRIEGIPENEFLSIFGLYALTPTIFDFLEENINNKFRERGEFQLTTCLEQVRQQEGMTGYVVQGKSFDIGIPDVYLQTLIDFRNR